jgi:hypothetical protein
MGSRRSGDLRTRARTSTRLFAVRSTCCGNWSTPDHATTLKPGAGELPAEAAILCADEIPDALRDLGVGCALRALPPWGTLVIRDAEKTVIAPSTGG